MSLEEKSPEAETLFDSVDIRLADLAPDFNRYVKEQGISDEQADALWTFVRNGYGVGYSDSLNGIKFPKYRSSSSPPTPEIADANEGFRRIFDERQSQSIQD